MKRIYKNFVLFAMTLQILILLCGIVAIPVAAAENDVPPTSMPLSLKGTILVDGEPAPINTQIIAKINNDLIGSTQSDQVGRYGSSGGTLLQINCDSEDYGNIIFYVNGVKSMSYDMDTLINAKPDDVVIEFNIIATSPVVEKENKVTGGGFGGSAPTNDTDSESLSESTPSASTTPLKSVAATQLTDDSVEYEEEVPESETGSPMILLLIGAILFLGIIITVGYKLKEN